MVITCVKIISLKAQFSQQSENFHGHKYRCGERISKSCELLSCYHYYTAALAHKSLWCASGVPVLSSSISIVLKAYLKHFFPSIPHMERQDKTCKRTEVLRFIGIHRRQKTWMQKPLLAHSSHTLKPEHTRACKKPTLYIPGWSVIVRSHKKAKNKVPTPCYPL